MIFLWNRERVVKEIIELATLKISQRLNVSESQVHVKMEIEDGCIKPSFGIDTQDISEERVNSVLQSVWGVLRLELTSRLKGLHINRYGFER